MRRAHRGGLLRLRPGATPLGGAAAAQGRRKKNGEERRGDFFGKMVDGMVDLV